MKNENNLDFLENKINIVNNEEYKQTILKNENINESNNNKDKCKSLNMEKKKSEIKSEEKLLICKKNIKSRKKTKLIKNIKQIDFLSHFKKNFENFQILNKYNISNKSYIYPLNINLNYIPHNIK